VEYLKAHNMLRLFLRSGVFRGGILEGLRVSLSDVSRPGARVMVPVDYFISGKLVSKMHVSLLRLLRRRLLFNLVKCEIAASS